MSRGSVGEIFTSDTKALKRFVALERHLLGSNPLFVSDIDDDVINRLSGRSSFFSDMERTLFVASNGTQDLARCAGLINHRYQKAKSEAVGFIGHFAAVPDRGPEVELMIEKAEAWLKERGVTRVIAPYNGAALLGSGLLTTAFDKEPMFPFMWHPPYYADYFVNSGYEPTYPLWHYTIDFTSAKYRTAMQRAAKNNAVSVRPVSKKNWKQDLETLRQVLNESFKEEWEFHPCTSEELHEFFDPIKPVLDTRQMLIGEVDGKPAGWCLGFPDWNPLFRSFNGKLRPFQIIKLMLGAGRYSRAGLIGIGVLADYKGTGLAHVLATTLYRRYEERGLKEAFYYPVNEHNHRSRQFAESIGGTGRVLYHCYDKRLG
jgi:GNAT superfamily N-acetyltransferase